MLTLSIWRFDLAEQPGGTGPIASTRHTVILCAILLLVAGVGSWTLHSPAAARPQWGSGAGLLVGLIVAEIGLLYYVWVGVRRGGGGLRDLVVTGRVTAARLLVDFLVGVLLFVLLSVASALMAQWLGRGDTSLVNTLTSRAAAQPVLWILVSLAAAVSEELTYRGYLQRQFEVRLKSPLLAILAQAILFGVTHGYQGGILVLRITILGAIFGLTAWVRRSRLPGIFAHFGLDIAGGFHLFH
jgi:hypothetical protein